MRHHAALTAVILATRAAAHGYIETFTLDRTAYEGYERWNNNHSPSHIGWSYSTEDEGPELDIASPDFACRRGAKVAPAYGSVTAGGDIDILWTSSDKKVNPDGWAESHHGPIFLYIAPCSGECAAVDKTQLKWTKIAEAGVVSGTPNNKGIWATDLMRQNGGHTKYKLPASIKAGNYVLRSEIIALHKAHEKTPEFYMQCGNIKVTGTGTDDLSGSGVVASQLYSKSDAVFGFDLYNGGKAKWVNPGPKLYTGAASGPASISAMGPTPTPTTLATSTTTAATSTTASTKAATPHPADEKDEGEYGGTVTSSSVTSPPSPSGRPPSRACPLQL